MLFNLIMIYFSLVMAGMLAAKRNYELFPVWLICAGMFFIAYSTDNEFSTLERLADQREALVAFLDFFRPEEVIMIQIITILLVVLLIFLLWLEYFSPRYICHICEDAGNKLGKLEYQKNDGAHKACTASRIPGG